MALGHDPWHAACLPAMTVSLEERLPDALCAMASGLSQVGIFLELPPAAIIQARVTSSR